MGFDRFLTKNRKIVSGQGLGLGDQAISTELFTAFVDKGSVPIGRDRPCFWGRGALFFRAPSGAATMKPEIHPNYTEIKVICSCGNEFTTRSTLGQDLHVEVCSSCHPFYTGKQKIVDSGGRVDKFRKRYAKQAAS